MTSSSGPGNQPRMQSTQNKIQEDLNLQQNLNLKFHKSSKDAK